MIWRLYKTTVWWMLAAGALVSVGHSATVTITTKATTALETNEDYVLSVTRRPWNTFPIASFVGPVATNTLQYAIYTNAMRMAVGRDSRLWIAGDWPGGTNAPTKIRNTNSLLAGWQGMTAISSWDVQHGHDSRSPFTNDFMGTVYSAVTKRHAITANHASYGAAPGMTYWFCDRTNNWFPMTIADRITEPTNSMGLKNDVAVVQFTTDLPSGIDTLDLVKMETNHIAATTPWPLALTGTSHAHVVVANSVGGFIVKWGTLFCTCQHGRVFGVGIGVGSETCSSFTGSDSGNPNMVPMPNGRLALFSLTSGNFDTDVVQASIDALCVSSGLDTNNYRLTQVDLTLWPQP